MFGDLRVVTSEETHTRFRTRKAALLLAYLALHSQQAQSRERLADLFWGDKEPAGGRADLSTALSQLRRQLEPPGTPDSLFLADKQQVRLHPAAVTTDVADFERFVAQAWQNEDKAEKAALLQQAVALYRGDLLPDCYEDWAAGEQTRCRLLFQESLLRLTQLWEESGRWGEALSMAQRACATDPFAEEAYRAQMRLLVRLKKPSAALRLYADMEALFGRELGTRPSAATRQMAEMIHSDPRAALLMRAEEAANTHSAAPAQARSAAVTVGHDSAPSVEAPPLSALPPPASAPALPAPVLPLQLTRFFGRDQEREQLCALLQTSGARLVSLLGPGGAGKTRLALEVAAQVAPSFANRVWFVPLADISDASLIVSTLIHALHLPPSAQADPLERVVTHLGSAPCLLVLDNLEHLLRDTPQVGKNDNPGMSGSVALSRLLLERVPALTCLVTSRQALRLGGEHVYALPPLALPSETDAASLETLRGNDSIALYLDRAHAARPDFALTTQNASAIAALCRKLDGMPLAIEMAAAWVKTISPAKMLERLERQLDLLVSRRRDLPPRHQSLRATIEWSYELLSPELQAFFTRLGVFRGGWTLEAAEAVCGGDALFALSELQEHSLIVQQEDTSQEKAGQDNKEQNQKEVAEIEMRYRMLEPLREFALEKLQDEPRVRERHQAFFLDFAEEASPKLLQEKSVVWFQSLQVEHDNLRAALGWCLERKNDPGNAAAAGLRFCAAMDNFWYLGSHVQEARHFLTNALARAAGLGRTQERAAALRRSGFFASYQSDYDAARPLLEEALAISKESGDAKGAGYALKELAWVASHRRDYDRARPLLEESLALLRESGERYGLAQSLHELGIMAEYEGDYARARSLYEQVLELFRELGNHERVVWTLHGLGFLALCRKDLAQARSLLTESLGMFRDSEDRPGKVRSLDRFANLALAEEQAARAARLLGAADAAREAIGSPQPPSEREEHDRVLGAARAAIEENTLGETTFAEVWAEGQAMSLEQAVEYALTGGE